MEYFKDVLISLLLQIVFTVGVIVIFGLLIGFCNKAFYSNFKRHARAVCYATGFIGTPVHELSHALFCLIFGHRITRIVLFQINSADGTLGYVEHAYNKRNVYQNIGNFFIGVAPILVISVIMFVIAYFLLPAFVDTLGTLPASIEDVEFVPLMKNIWEIIKTFFSLIGTWQWWVFFVIGLFLCLHMTLSTADIKGAWSGFVLLLIVLLIVDIILEAVSGGLLTSFTSVVISIGGYLLSIMLISLIISLLYLIISFVFRIFIR
ncbi:MAG: metalloprotease family protein [Clostridia bacterium]|nr:metalloprotease family protein [Clostridia bacterium]